MQVPERRKVSELGIRVTPLSTLNTQHFAVLDESADWIVVDKPPFSRCIRASRGRGFTLWDGLRELLSYELREWRAGLDHQPARPRDQRADAGGENGGDGANAVHGDEGAAGREGIPRARLGLAGAEEFTVDAPMLRHGEREPSRIHLKQMVHPDGAAARTRFRVERRFSGATTAGDRFALVRAFPETGRMHQIRVHLAHAGHPVVGDKIYGPDEGCYLEFIETGWTPALAARLLLPRHALHSASAAPAGARTRAGRRRFQPTSRRGWRKIFSRPRETRGL